MTGKNTLFQAGLNLLSPPASMQICVWQWLLASHIGGRKEGGAIAQIGGIREGLVAKESIGESPQQHPSPPPPQSSNSDGGSHFFLFCDLYILGDILCYCSQSFTRIEK